MHAMNHNLIGYNEVVRPLKCNVRDAYQAWKNGRNSDCRDQLWRTFQSCRNKYTKELNDF